MSELRNCPFCGGAKADMGIQSKEGLVFCPECKARAPWGVWNRRATDTPPADDAALEAARRLDTWLKGEVELSPLNLKCCVRALIASRDADNSALSPRIEPSDEVIEAVARGIYADNGWWRAVDADDDGRGRYRDSSDSRLRAVEWSDLDGEEKRMLKREARAAILSYQKTTSGDPQGEANQIRSAVLNEREECAKVADTFNKSGQIVGMEHRVRNIMARDIAAAIRSRTSP